MSDTTQVSAHYDAKYFDYHKGIGEFGGWANVHKFKDSIKPTDTVIDFGCGGGELLNSLNCRHKIGIEPNDSAAAKVRNFGIKHFYNPIDALSELGEGVADVIVSDNALEHTLNPLQELKNLRPLLKTGGIIQFVVPCDSISKNFDPNDMNHHLFSWSPMNLGHLFMEAGYRVESSKPYIHKWPRYYQQISRLGWPAFNLACRIYARYERSWFQVRIKATKPAD